ncbi:Hypothetical predicted protein [Xyrichtys novacula]|uniref:Uncharacterized protein n=1 Tax=Xyrichtys novacula TaxID=13765 RepID=A0AAV1HL98_XYRNO|nr:Hypothetical predicted protein [Xyrichtys novacula]
MAESEMGPGGSKAAGLFKQPQEFKTVLGLKARLKVFVISEKVSRALQNPKVTVSETKRMTSTLRSAFACLRTDKEYLAIWEESNVMAKKLQLEAPLLPRPRKLSRKRGLDIGEEVAQIQPEPSTVEELFRVKHWHPLVHVLTEAMDRRFGEFGTSVAASLEQLVFKSAPQQDFNEEIVVVEKH